MGILKGKEAALSHIEQSKTAFLATISVCRTFELPDVSRFLKFNRFLRTTSYVQ